jgi:hypothetical protein
VKGIADTGFLVGRDHQQVGQPQAMPFNPEKSAQTEYGDTQLETPRQAQVAAPWQTDGIVTQWNCVP